MLGQALVSARDLWPARLDARLAFAPALALWLAAITPFAALVGSRLATPKSALLGLPPEGDSGGGGGGGGRGEKRRNESDEGDPAVVAATALAGMAGSGGLPAKRIKQEEREVGMEVD